MSISITSDDIKNTLEKPDKLINCDFIGLCFYIKKIEDKGELLVVAKKEFENKYAIKCFNWMNSMEFITN